MKSIRGILGGIRQADQKFTLIRNGDRIMVGVSGGKDSIVLLYALVQYQKFNCVSFEIVPAILDLGFDGFNPIGLTDFVSSLGLTLIVIDSRDVYQILKAHTNDKGLLPCSICSRMKKAAINKAAIDNNCNKVAFAHHSDDAIETLFMNEIYGGRISSFSPKMLLEKTGIEFIRPLSLVREKEIKECVKEENLPTFSSCCPNDKYTVREEIKTLLNKIYKKYPQAEDNFLTMLTNYEHNEVWENSIYLKIENTNLSLKPVVTVNDAYKETYLTKEIFRQDSNDFDDIIKGNIKIYLVYLKDIPIGIFRYKEIDSNNVEFLSIGIKNEYRNKNYGSLILKFFENHVSMQKNPLNIIVKCSDLGQTFFEKNNYQIVEREGISALYKIIKK